MKSSHLPLLLGLLFATGAATFAQPPAASGWADPTRPPVVDSGASAPRAAKPASAASAAAAPRLQSVQVGGTAPSALVDGRIVEVGDALGSARVVAIDADGLTLRNPQGRSERMLLISAAIAKRDANSPRPVAALVGSESAEGRRP